MVRPLVYLLFALLPAIALTACSIMGSTDDSGGSLSSAASSSEMVVSSIERETRNVAYEGVVQPAGISIYMEGTHRLSLENGKFILLESDAVDLNGYVDERVRVFGSLRPTVEAGGMIMRVERADLLEEEAMEQEESEVSEALSSDAQDRSSSSLSSFSSFSSFTSLPKDPLITDSALEARIEYMAEQDYSEGNWTQQYCTTHIGFCAPVHRNFWYKSFGATASALWHVEINSEPVERLGDGPIVLRLLPGSSDAEDGDVSLRGENVVGYRMWSENRHFEISADARLRSAVEYLVTHIGLSQSE